MSDSAGMTGMYDVVWLTFSLIGIVIILFLTFFFTKWVSKKMTLTGGSKIKIIDKAVLGQDKYVALIKVGEKVFLVGITGQNINLISELDGKDFENIEEPPLPVKDFKSYLNSAKEFTNKIRSNKNDSSN